MQMLDELLSGLSTTEEPSFTHRRAMIKGKRRNVTEPNDAMVLVHENIRRYIYSLPISYESTMGSLPGRSAVMNALTHRNGTYFYQFDIREAFQSLHAEQLAGALLLVDPDLGLLDKEEVTAFLKRYCCDRNGRLSFGGPASPALFNLYCEVCVDRNIRDLCYDDDTIYTRYVDDCTISSVRPIPRILRKRVRGVVTRAGFSIQHPKSSLLSIERSPIILTGIVIEKGGHLSLPPSSLRRLSRKLYEAREKGIRNLSKNERDVLAGFVGELRAVEAYVGAKSEARNIVRSCDEFFPRKSRRKPKVSAATPDGRLFSEEFLDRIRNEVPLVEVIGRRVDLKKRGKGEFAGLCPFHNEKTPSFTVSPSKGFFHCFGCGSHGDAIGFLIQSQDNMTFPEAVRYLSETYQIFPPIER